MEGSRQAYVFTCQGVRYTHGPEAVQQEHSRWEGRVRQVETPGGLVWPRFRWLFRPLWPVFKWFPEGGRAGTETAPKSRKVVRREARQTNESLLEQVWANEGAR